MPQGWLNWRTKLRAEAGEFLTALEFFSDVGLGIALENIPGLVFPLQSRASFYVLVEAGSGSMQVPLDSILTEVMEWGIDEGIVARWCSSDVRSSKGSSFGACAKSSQRGSDGLVLSSSMIFQFLLAN